MVQSLAVGVQNANTWTRYEEGKVSNGGTNEAQQAATGSAITVIGNDVKRVVTKVDIIEEEVGVTKKTFVKTNLRVEKSRGGDQGTCKENSTDGIGSS